MVSANSSPTKHQSRSADLRFGHRNCEDRLMSLLRSMLVFGFIGILADGNINGASAQGGDPHQLYEQRCAGCHVAHAGTFAHESLITSEGGVFGRNSNEELGAFLRAGHGNLSAKEIETIIEHLISILRSGRLFRKKCRICHDRAVIFARRKLIIKDGELIGRYTKRRIRQFLLNHGRLNADELPVLLDALKRQLTTQAD